MLIPRWQAITVFCLFRSVLTAQQTATFVPVRLSVTEDRGALEAARTAADKQKLKNVEIFDRQSFRLTVRGATLGVFVTGRATDPGDKRNLVCFASFVERNIAPQLLMTIGGAIPFSLLRCGVPKAVGLVAEDVATGKVRIAMIYGDSIRLPASHGGESYLDCNDPAVLVWDRSSHQLTIDQANTGKALDARAENLPDLLRALRGTNGR